MTLQPQSSEAITAFHVLLRAFWICCMRLTYPWFNFSHGVFPPPFVATTVLCYAFSRDLVPQHFLFRCSLNIKQCTRHSALCICRVIPYEQTSTMVVRTIFNEKLSNDNFNCRLNYQLCLRGKST